ncbi:VOC family protein [uncultured Roseibium sp.]|uniref:VOC family protein n=1 Tax=uncultured Roseibium sp. TaxID=1936171 RepID=UPI0026070723|nr:VOC family protein [uncultured Roseibium sp.]
MSATEGLAAPNQSQAPNLGINRIILYVRDVEMSASFYAFFFGFKVMTTPKDRLTELFMEDGGVRLLLHKAGKAQKLGQVSLKLVFDVEDVCAFSSACADKGLKFGTIHQADGYEFANAKDPDGNAIQISSRAFKTP